MRNNTPCYDWCYISGRISVLESNLLNSNLMERLLSSDNLGSVLTNLNNTPLKAYFTHINHLYEFETLLDKYYYDLLNELRSLSPTSVIYDFFLTRNEFLRIKKFIKSRIAGTDGGNVPDWTIIWDTRHDAHQDKTTPFTEIFSESVAFLKKTITQHSPPPPTDSPPSQGTTKKELLPFITDLICDGAYLRYVESLSDKTGAEIINSYLNTYHFVKGLEAIRRAMVLGFDMNLLNRYFLEGFDQHHLFRKLAINTAWASGKTLNDIIAEAHCDAYLQNILTMLPDLSQKISLRYEVTTNNYLLDMLRPVRYVPFGPERVFGYLCGLTTEVFNLRLVLGGKVYRIENRLLRERLRKAYV